MIIIGDCIEKLKELKDNSVDVVVTDPPYGIGFMGKEWDNFKPSTVEKYKEISDSRAKERTDGRKAGLGTAKEAEIYDLSIAAKNKYQDWCYKWAKECFRVLKPGGHMLVSNSTRMYHRMACAIEDAGFEVRDMIEWVYGSGFPKSLNIGKAVDKLQGNERKWIGKNPNKASEEAEKASAGKSQSGRTTHPDITKGTSEWEGWGTALKPAHEPICMARKPLAEKTVAENVLKYGTGGINIDESRVETDGSPRKGGATTDGNLGWKPSKEVYTDGRFPANLITDGSDEVKECFPETKSTGGLTKNVPDSASVYGKYGVVETIKPTDSGNASRFFKSIIYQAKASKSERNKGCEVLENNDFAGGSIKHNNLEARCSQCNDRHYDCNGQCSCGANDWQRRETKNNHPTVKPIALMEYLIKMVTPKGGIVLDPFAGSGSTLVAAKKLGHPFIGIEKEEEYVVIAHARLSVFPEVLL